MDIRLGCSADKAEQPLQSVKLLRMRGPTPSGHEVRE